MRKHVLWMGIFQTFLYIVSLNVYPDIIRAYIFSHAFLWIINILHKYSLSTYKHAHLETC